MVMTCVCGRRSSDVGPPGGDVVPQRETLMNLQCSGGVDPPRYQSINTEVSIREPVGGSVG